MPSRFALVVVAGRAPTEAVEQTEKWEPSWPLVGRFLTSLLVVLACVGCSMNVSIPPGVIFFGTGLDSQTHLLTGPTDTFEVGDPVASGGERWTAE